MVDKKIDEEVLRHEQFVELWNNETDAVRLLYPESLTFEDVRQKLFVVAAEYPEYKGIQKHIEKVDDLERDSFFNSQPEDDRQQYFLELIALARLKARGVNY